MRNACIPNTDDPTEFMAALLSDVRRHQRPDQLRLLDERFEGDDDDDDNSELTRQVIYNNARSDYDDDDCKVGSDPENTVNSALVTAPLFDVQSDYHGYNEDREYYPYLQSMPRSTRGNFHESIAPIIKTLLVISLASAASLYTLRLLPKLVKDFSFAEILRGIFTFVHWTWYLVAIWPVRFVSWSLAAVRHALKMVVRPTWATLATEGLLIIVYFLRRLRRGVVIDGVKSADDLE